tara:strand:- start:31 stop:420 length:390 start_codon:yes stop_codon:yes gene_type:complete
MNRVIFIFTVLITFLDANNLRLAEGFYPSRLPKKIHTYKEFSNQLTLKSSTAYYKNGHKSYQVEYDSNGLNSRKIWWHDNGNKSKMITFKNGLVDGIWSKWAYDGAKTTERFYKNGQMINERKFSNISK